MMLASAKQTMASIAFEEESHALYGGVRISMEHISMEMNIQNLICEGDSLIIIKALDHVLNMSWNLMKFQAG